MSWRDKVHAMRDGTNLGIVPTPVPPKLPKPGFVGSVSALPLHIPEKKEAANDCPPVQSAHLEPDIDPDRWCWPHSSAMNGAEIDTFAVRLQKFTNKGLARNDSEALADKLVLRDRDLDDRRVCLECKHFSGQGPESWRCGNWRAAGVAIRSRDAQLPADLVVQLQRCDEFTAHPTSTPQGAEDEHEHP